MKKVNMYCTRSNVDYYYILAREQMWWLLLLFNWTVGTLFFNLKAYLVIFIILTFLYWYISFEGDESF